MTPSKYQQSIYNHIENDRHSLVVEAVAGSGKSTTLEGATKCIPLGSKTAMFAFNRDIVSALKTRIKDPSIQVSTINSFGWGICRQNQRSVQLQPDRTAELLMNHFNLDDPKDRSLFYSWKYPTIQLVSLLKANCVFESVQESKIIEIADQYGIDIPEHKDFISIFNDVWDASRSCAFGIMDFSDQIYQPLRQGWPIPKFDVALVDELQDLNPAQQQLMLGASRRFIGVGDSRQAIYAFAGADASSMANMIQRTGAQTLPLSVCYRCPIAVVELAQKIVPQIEWSPNAIAGRVSSLKMGQFRSLAASGDFVLCRVTADLVSECLKMIREGKKAMVKGRNIGDQLIVIINKLSIGNQESTANLYTAICKYHVDQLEKLSRARREQAIETLNDTVETIKVLLESETTVADVKQRINTIFSDKVSGIMFSTIHKAKGLESKRVFILRPDLLPHPNAKTPVAKEQEQNLEYVAITRSMNELYFVPKER